MKEIFLIKDESGIIAGWRQIINFSFENIDITTQYGVDKKKGLNEKNGGLESA